MSFRVRIEGVPTEDVLREIIEAAREAGADEVVVETTHEAGEDWVRAGFSEQARIVAAPVAALEQALSRERLRRSARSTCRRTTQSQWCGRFAGPFRACRGARAAASSYRPAKGGRPSTTSCATATRPC